MTYLSEEVDLKACGFVSFRLAVIQVVPHRQHKLLRDRMEQAKIKLYQTLLVYYNLFQLQHIFYQTQELIFLLLHIFLF